MASVSCIEIRKYLREHGISTTAEIGAKFGVSANKVGQMMSYDLKRGIIVSEQRDFDLIHYKLASPDKLYRVDSIARAVEFLESIGFAVYSDR